MVNNLNSGLFCNGGERVCHGHTAKKSKLTFPILPLKTEKFQMSEVNDGCLTC